MKKIVIISFISVALMSMVDGIINPGYVSKSLVKLLLFLVLPLILKSFKDRQEVLNLLIPASKKSMVTSLLLGGVIYLGILGIYILIAPHIDLDTIKVALETDLGVNRENFLLVALYISLINSFLEEFFFRGFIFLGLLRVTKRWKAYVFSALIFAIYHVAIIGSWFSPVVFLLAMTGLFAGGMIFNFLNEKNGNILNSWLVHLMANLAINTVGLFMFDLL